MASTQSNQTLDAAFPNARDRLPSSPSSSESMAEDCAPEHRPFACTYPGCSRTFKRKYTLKDHLNAHVGEKPFVCPVTTCGKSFTTSGNLSRHKRLHPWLDTPLPCLVDGCECEFPSDEKLQRHMQSHFDASGEFFRCEIGTCGRVFTTSGNLRRHIKQNHSDVLDGEQAFAQLQPRARARSSSAGRMPDAAAMPLPYPRRMERELPSDHEILDALSCLFDDETDAKATGSYAPTAFYTPH